MGTVGHLYAETSLAPREKSDAAEAKAKARAKAKAKAEAVYPPSTSIAYKTVKSKGKDYSLQLHLFNPKSHKLTNSTPCIVLFHGGGWNNGRPSSYFSTHYTTKIEGLRSEANHS